MGASQRGLCIHLAVILSMSTGCWGWALSFGPLPSSPGRPWSSSSSLLPGAPKLPRLCEAPVRSWKGCQAQVQGLTLYLSLSLAVLHSCPIDGALGIVLWHFANKGLYNQSYGFSRSHVWMWELDNKDGWKWKSLGCVWLFVTPWTIQSMEFSRPEYWSEQSFPSSGGFPNPGIEPRSLALQVDS